MESNGGAVKDACHDVGCIGWHSIGIILLTCSRGRLDLLVIERIASSINMYNLFISFSMIQT